MTHRLLILSCALISMSTSILYGNRDIVQLDQDLRFLGEKVIKEQPTHPKPFVPEKSTPVKTPAEPVLDQSRQQTQPKSLWSFFSDLWNSIPNK